MKNNNITFYNKDCSIITKFNEIITPNMIYDKCINKIDYNYLYDKIIELYNIDNNYEYYYDNLNNFILILKEEVNKHLINNIKEFPQGFIYLQCNPKNIPKYNKQKRISYRKVNEIIKQIIKYINNTISLVKIKTDFNNYSNYSSLEFIDLVFYMFGTFDCLNTSILNKESDSIQLNPDNVIDVINVYHNITYKFIKMFIDKYDRYTNIYLKKSIILKIRENIKYKNISGFMNNISCLIQNTAQIILIEKEINNLPPIIKN